MKRLHRLLAALSILHLVSLGLATAARAYAVAPAGDPEALGFSSSRLARIAAWQQSQVDAGAFSGAVAAIARNGKVAYLRAVGFRDRAKTIPLQPDAIFWIASMTKPVTSVAAMMLVEEGKLDLTASVHRYLPELKDMMVAVETKDPVTGKADLAREPQKRAMTVEDLLRHTRGTGLWCRWHEGGPTVQVPLPRLPASASRRDKTLADFVSNLAKLPLAHQPGAVWDYGLSVDVLSRVVEVASGQPLRPIPGDTPVQAAGHGRHRLFRCRRSQARPAWLIRRPAGGAGRRTACWLMSPDRPRLFSGGGGLVSTAADYLRFGQMLLNGGELDGVRILSPATVQRMTTNALPSDIRFASYLSCRRDPGRLDLGLGFAIRSDADTELVPGSVGSFTWMGASGSYFWVDPAEQLIAVQLIHAAPENHGPALSHSLSQSHLWRLPRSRPRRPAAATARRSIDATISRLSQEPIGSIRPAPVTCRCPARSAASASTSPSSMESSR